MKLINHAAFSATPISGVNFVKKTNKPTRLLNQSVNTINAKNKPQVQFGYEDGLLWLRLAAAAVGVGLAGVGGVGMANNKPSPVEESVHEVVVDSAAIDTALEDNMLESFSPEHSQKVENLSQKMMEVVQTFDNDPSLYWAVLHEQVPEVMESEDLQRQAFALYTDASNIQDMNDFRQYMDKWIEESSLSDAEKQSLKQEMFEFANDTEAKHEAREAARSGQVWMLSIGLFLIFGDVLFLFLPELLEGGLDW